MAGWLSKASCFYYRCDQWLTFDSNEVIDICYILCVAAWQPGQGQPYQWDNMPNAPPPANESEEPAGGGPPSMDGFQTIQGYENVGSFDNGVYTEILPIS